MGTDESSFIMVLCQRNHAQLRMVFDEYQRMTGHSIEKAIKKEFSGNSEEALLGVVEAIRNKPLFFAKCLHKSMKGFGTNDSQLIRNIVGRVEIDMGAIKQEYQNAFGKSLATAIEVLNELFGQQFLFFHYIFRVILQDITKNAC